MSFHRGKSMCILFECFTAVLSREQNDDYCKMIITQHSKPFCF